MQASLGLASLGEKERGEVEGWLAEFQRAWSEKQLKSYLRKLPPVGDPRRLPALLEMVKIDLQRHWEQGRKVRVETYLKALPELPAAGLTTDLIEAEWTARRRVGAPADLATFAERFPDQVSQLGTMDSPGPAPESVAGGDATRPTVPPVPPPPIPGPRLRDAESLPEKFGRYRILRKLGQGGMGSVYLAHDTELDRQLALKVPLLSSTDGTQVLERFNREARAAATLSHPNICPVYDVGAIDGIHFVTMAYIEGKPLSELMRTKGPLPQKSVAAVIRKLALGMQEAHGRGIIHRDLKPANVMINQRNEPVIMDFGLARRTQENVRLTQSGAIMGTPAYMSPEQVNGDAKAIGPASDVYSLGVMLYEMLTGQLPFQGPATAVLAAILTKDPPRPSTLRPDLDPALEAICLRAMARNLPDRYGSMRDLGAALTAYIKGAKAASAEVKIQAEGANAALAEPTPAGEGLATELLGKLVQRMESDAETIRESQHLMAQHHARSRWLPWVIAAVVVMALGAVTWVAVVGLNRPPSNTTNNVAVTLNLPREASDPSVVLILLDGKERTRDELTRTLELSVGEHVLKMKRTDGTVLVTTFNVGKEADQKIDVPAPKDEVVVNKPGPGDKGPQTTADGFTPLFNGRDVSGWSIYPTGTTGWQVENGVLVGSGPDSTLFNDRGDYKNFHFRVEAQINDGGTSAQLFRALFEPGRSRAYYGVIDSTGPWAYKTGSLGTSGSTLWGTRDKLSKPGQWFTQEVIADGNHLVTLVDGKKVADHVDVDKAYVRGFLGLLKEGKDTVVKFRKVEIKELAPTRPVVRPGKEPGWVQIFNGKDLSGWKPQSGTTAGWEVQDGVLVGSAPESVLFTQRGDYRNFHFRVEAQINDGGTAAHLFRVAFEPGRPRGYYAVLDSTGSWSSKIGSLGTAGSMYANSGPRLVKPGVWFTQEVIAEANHIVIKVDGEKVVDYIDQNSSYKDGHLALFKDSANTVVKFRTIEVKELPAP